MVYFLYMEIWLYSYILYFDINYFSIPVLWSELVLSEDVSRILLVEDVSRSFFFLRTISFLELYWMLTLCILFILKD